jgi:hypothetical protein
MFALGNRTDATGAAVTIEVKTVVLAAGRLDAPPVAALSRQCPSEWPEPQ